MSIQQFIFDEGVIGLTMATMMGFGATNLIKALRQSVIDPYMTRVFKTTTKSYIGKVGDIIASVLEFLIIVVIVYLLYRFVITKMFKNEMQNREKEEKIKEQRQEEMMKDVEDIRNAIVAKVPLFPLDTNYNH